MLALDLFCQCQAGQSVSPSEWLTEQTPPQFRAGHTLPRLTRYGWSLPIETRKILAEKWGYALEFGGYVDKLTVARAVSERDSPEAQVLELSRQAPEKYKLSIILSREMPPPDELGAAPEG